MGVFRTHIWDTQLLHCQAALVLLTLTLPFLQVTSLRGGPTRVGFFGDEYKQRKIGSLSIMLECGHRNYRKLDHLSTNSSWFAMMFSRFNWEGLQQHWLQCIFSFQHIIERFSCVAADSSCYVSVFLDSTQWIPMGFEETKSSSAIGHWTFRVSKLEFPLKCLALKILECQGKNNNRFSTNLFHVEWKVHPKNHHKGW